MWAAKGLVPSHPASEAVGFGQLQAGSPGPFWCRVKQPLRATQGPCSEGRMNPLGHIFVQWSEAVTPGE